MSTHERHLVLVGMMGAGKSTVGARCAARLGRPFIDTDELVETRAGAPVADVFVRDGEAAFRDIERGAIADACATPTPTVIAVGGGAVVDADNRERMRDTGFVVWLRAPAAQLAKRVGDGRSRPLLNADREATLERLNTERRSAYEAAAHTTVDTTGLNVAVVVDAVLEKLAARTEPRS
jgi:shikimate kinase